MYQAQITYTATGAPVTDLDIATKVSTWLGGGGAEIVDAGLGIWLIGIHAGMSRLIDEVGFLSAKAGDYTIEIDTP
jgi:hypothetical protein